MDKLLTPKEAFLRSTDKPAMPRPSLADVPPPLASARAWCGWKWTWKEADKKWIKKPFNAKSLETGSFTETGWNNSDNLLSLPRLMGLIEASPNGADFGIGLVSPKGVAEGGGACAIDFDNILHPDGTFINKKLQAIVEATKGRILWEASASQTGLHAIGFGLRPGSIQDGKKKYAIEGGGELELLVQGRFCAITGDWLKVPDSLPTGSLNEVLDAFQKRKDNRKEPPRLTVAPAMGSQEEGFRGYLRERASRYVQAMDPSIDGQGGHAQLMRVATVLRHGFQYGGEYSAWESDGLEILHQFNRKGDPESEAQLAHKWKSCTTIGRDLASEALSDWEAKQGRGSGSKQGANSSSTPSSPPAHVKKEEWAIVEEESLRPAEAIEELQKQEFLWEGFIPRGDFGIISGWPGAGKSSALGGIVAAVTRGGDFIGPTGSLPGMDQSREPMGALWISCEEKEPRIKARLQESGADLSKVHILRTVKELNENGKLRKRTFQLPKDLDLLRRWLTKLKPGIIILDAMSGLFSADYDSTKSQKSREILNELANMAEEFNATIILINHLTKASSNKDFNKSGPAYLAAEGSMAFSGAARFLLMVGQHPEDKEVRDKHDRRKVLFVAKANEFKDGLACSFRVRNINLESGGDVRIPIWEAAVEMEEEEFRGFAKDGDKPGPEPVKLTMAMEELKAFFREKDGSAESIDLEEKKKAMEAELGLSQATIRRAVEELRKGHWLRKDPFSKKWLFTPPIVGSQEELKAFHDEIKSSARG